MLSLNADGLTNTQDLTKFLSWHTAADDRADWNHDGSVNTQDYTAYFNDSNAADTFGGRGVLSSFSLDIRLGYAGYRWDQPLSKYHARCCV